VVLLQYDPWLKHLTYYLLGWRNKQCNKTHFRFGDNQPWENIHEAIVGSVSCRFMTKHTKTSAMFRFMGVNYRTVLLVTKIPYIMDKLAPMNTRYENGRTQMADKPMTCPKPVVFNLGHAKTSYGVCTIKGKSL
jgi:hypothetical protein